MSSRGALIKLLKKNPERQGRKYDICAMLLLFTSFLYETKNFQVQHRGFFQKMYKNVPPQLFILAKKTVALWHCVNAGKISRSKKLFP